MKKRVMIITIASLASLYALAGCKSANYGGDSWNEKVNKNRTQLYIHNYEGGFGSEWLKNAKAEYEELHQDDVYEEGKKGVQVIIKADKNLFTDSEISTNPYDVLFVQDCSIYSIYKAGAIEDISEAVKGTNPYETGKTIESKLTEEQKAALNFDGKYYGLNHYVGSWGISYNKTMFEEKGFYLVKGHERFEGEMKFTGSYEEAKKSFGRDGIEGTDDDGLPETYDDFIALCDYISSLSGYYPITFSGKQKDTYVTSLLNSLIVDAMGKEKTLASYNMKVGESFDNLVKLNVTKDGSGKITGVSVMKDANGNPVMDDPVVFNGNNGYETYRSKAHLDAIKFFYDLLCTPTSTSANTPKYFTSDCLKATYDYQSAQKTMVDNLTKTAMIVEGQWWENEAASSAKKYGTNYDFGWMPLPRADRDATHKSVYFDSMNCYSIVKKGLSAVKKSMAMDFLQYVSTDASLKKFTKTTNAVKGMNYSLDAEDLSSLTSFGKSVYNFRKNSDLVTPLATNKEYVTNQLSLNPYSRYKAFIPASGGDVEKGSPSSTFLSNYNSSTKIDPETYFAGIYKYYAATWLGTSEN